jgi:hypothetical protein
MLIPNRPQVVRHRDNYALVAVALGASLQANSGYADSKFVIGPRFARLLDHDSVESYRIDWMVRRY